MSSNQYETHGLDTQKEVFFYEQDFYVLSNFSAFNISWKGIIFDTSEQVYHWEKFPDYPQARYEIFAAKSAHDAFKAARKYDEYKLPYWNDVKVSIMLSILWAKVRQHEYVYKKLMDTGDRQLIENSWRDSEWGWGPNKDGKNLLGEAWMAIRYYIQTHGDLEKAYKAYALEKT